MVQIELPIFGKLAFDPKGKRTVDDYICEDYIAAYRFQGKEIDLDVHFTGTNDDNISLVRQGLEDLSNLGFIAQQAILNNFEQGNKVKQYLKDWIDEFNDEELEKLLRETNKNDSIINRMFSILRVIRIGFYADSSDRFVVLDYALGYERNKGFRDNMLVVSLNQDWQVSEITLEG
jgi:hypothetical protein